MTQHANQRPNDHSIQRRRGGRRGQALVMTALLVAVLVGMMGLVLDGGLLYFKKRSMQAAADAGAMGAAHELWRRNTDYAAQIRPAALNDTGLNSYDDTDATVTVNHPPASGPNAGDNDFVEVIISQDSPTYFMRILNFNQATVRARAVAGLVPYNDLCVLALDRDQSSALKTNGSPTLYADCGIMTNSADPSALNGVGSSIVSGSWIGVSGNYTGGGTFTPPPEVDVPPMIDPLAYVSPPDYTGWPSASFDEASQTYLCPGGACVYDDEIQIAGGSVTFQPGIWVLQKGMQVTGGDVTGTEVCFYNVNASGNDHIDIGGNGVVTLSAPTSGPMKGILFFGDRNSPDKSPGNKIGRGNANSFFEGALYFPSQHLDWAGNPQTISAWTMVIANTINVSGTADVQQVGLPPAGEGPDITKATLVE